MSLLNGYPKWMFEKFSEESKLSGNLNINTNDKSNINNNINNKTHMFVLHNKDTKNH